MLTAVIMAGGKGERFWPRSRVKLPKQFLSLTDDGKSMIQHTVERLKKILNIENIFVVTNYSYVNLVIEQLPDLPIKNILVEPESKNTAPCIGLAAIHIRKKYKNSKMIVLPSDHLIKFNELFIDTLEIGLEAIEKNDNIITIGITPTYPETGYGYINFKRNTSINKIKNIYEVIKFVEKPNFKKAKQYINTGEYLWNSGIFIWNTDTILKCFEEFTPEIYKGLVQIEKFINTESYEKTLKEEYIKFHATSIDYAIMEKVKSIYVIPGNFGWDDVGSWLSLERIKEADNNGNIILGNIIKIKTSNSIIQGSNKLIATVGLDNIIIIDTEDALLVCNKAHTQDIKEIVEKLKSNGMIDYL